MRTTSDTTLGQSVSNWEGSSFGGDTLLTSSEEELPSIYDRADLYDAIVQPGPCEAFYREEARRWPGPVLELACGTGRGCLPGDAGGRLSKGGSLGRAGLICPG